MTLRKTLRVALSVLLVLILGAGFCVGACWWYLSPEHTRTDGIVYGHRAGRELTLDVLRPAEANGLGIAVVVSGGWRSNAEGFSVALVAPLLRRGYTVFGIYHVSQPKATVMETVDDLHRAVRFIRHRAREYGIDPGRIGVTGASAGGHLSLMLATRGGVGPFTAGGDDATGAESSAVQAVAIFCPVTDLLNLGDSTENPGDGGPPKSFVKAFGPRSREMAVWKEIGREVSPVYHVSAEMPPVLIFHGDRDTLVPLDQSTRFQARAREAGGTVDVIVRRGKAHAWLGMLWDIRRFADWFDAYLKEDR